MLLEGKKRALIMLWAASIIFSMIALRLFYLQLIMHDFYRGRSYDQRLRVITLSPDRGDIFDRSGNVLATTIDSYSIFVVPSAVKEKNRAIEVLSNALKLNRATLLEKINSKKPFVWVKRMIEVPLAAKLMEKDLAGFGFLPEKKRVYPKKKLASQILGFVGTDNQGLSGLELSFEK